MTSPDRSAWRFGLYCGHLLTLFGIALSNVLLGVAIVSSPWTAEGSRAALGRGRPLLVGLGIYAALLLLAIAASADPGVSVASAGELFTLAAIPLALLALRDLRRIRLLVDALIFCAALLAVFGLSQFLFGYGSIDRRIRGPFSHVMTFSGVLLLIDLLLIARMLYGPRADARSSRWLDRPWVSWAALVVINVALLNTLTRSAWIGLVAALVGLVWVRRPLWLAALPAAAVLFVLFAPVPILARALSTANLSDESTYDRLCMLEAGARMTAAHPLVGIGPKLVEYRYPIYRHPTTTRWNVPHLHNSYLQLAAERGLPSLGAFLGLLGLAGAAAWRGYRAALATGEESSDLHLGALAALVAFALAGLFENNWGDTEVQRMAVFLLALPFCLRGIGRATPEGIAP